MNVAPSEFLFRKVDVFIIDVYIYYDNLIARN